jgi:hypothetical protein
MASEQIGNTSELRMYSAIKGAENYITLIKTTCSKNVYLVFLNEILANVGLPLTLIYSYSGTSFSSLILSPLFFIIT